MKQELKPCPFCGSEEGVHVVGVDNDNNMHHITTANQFNMFTVCCCVHMNLGCGVSSGFATTITEAINKWNTRHDHIGDSAEVVKYETLTTDSDWDERFFQTALRIYDTFTDSVFKAALQANADNINMKFDTPLERAVRSIELAEIFINQLKEHSNEK